MISLPVPPSIMISIVILVCIAMSSGQGLKVNITGDVYLGAMFPIQRLGEGDRCTSGFNDQLGVQNLEAMLFALDKVNKEILHDLDFSLGVLAYDNCFSSTVALDRALNFVKLQSFTLDLDTMLQCADNSTPVPIAHGKLIGVVGPASSSVCQQLASFLRLFRIPQISYSATSTELSDELRYDYFLRTVSSDKYQAKAVVKILKTFEWNYVVGIFEDTSYGVNGFHEVHQYAEEQNICIADVYKVKRYFTTDRELVHELKVIMDAMVKLNNTNGQTVVVLFTQTAVTDILFELVVQHGYENRFIWVGVDAWVGYTVAKQSHKAALNTIGVRPKNKEVAEFDAYFTNLTPSTNTRNPWFKEYWEEIFNCSLTGPVTTSNKCADDLKLSIQDGTYDRNLNAYATMDTVYAFAYALKKWHRSVCPSDSRVCQKLKDAKVEDLMAFLKQVNFTNLAGQQFYFFNNGGPPRYSIMQYVSDLDVGYRWKEVGDVEFDNITDSMVFYEDNFGPQYRRSVCSEQCQPGSARHPIPNRKCCWTCHPCGEYQHLDIHNQSCVNCPNGTRANASKTGCEEIPETSMEWSNIWVIITVLLTCCGLVISGLIAALFYWQKETPIIMASGKELSFVLLAGVFLSYISTFVFVANPTPITCGATRFMLGASYTVCYAAILVKTNRIYRVFNIHTSKPKKVKFISAKSQLLITLGIVSVEIAALASWLIFDPPEVIHEYPTRAENVRVCEDSRDYAYLGALVYPIFLMIVCVYYAVKTRKTPDGFNETRYIAFGSYSFFVLWIAFTSIYFSVDNNTIRIVALCFASTINATVTLITLFITKAYVVLFRPQKNTRENVMARRRTHSYDTNNHLTNLSRMASAVSTWNSNVHQTPASQLSQSPSVFKGQPKRSFGYHLSVSAISSINLGASMESLNNVKDTTASAPDVSTTEAPIYSNVITPPAPFHRPFTDEELKRLTRKTSKDLGDERLKQFLENHLHTDGEGDDDDDNGNHLGINSGVPRRSLRSFRSRKKRNRSVKRTHSMDANLPNIIVTSPSREDNRILKASLYNEKKMVKVMHL